MKLNFKIIYFFIFLCSNSYGTENYFLKKFINEIYEFKYVSAKITASKINDREIRIEASRLVNILFFYDKAKKGNTDFKILTNEAKILRELSEGYYKLYHTPQNPDVFKNFNNAYELSKSINNLYLIKYSLLSLILISNYEIIQSNKNQIKYLNYFKEIISNNNDKYHYCLNMIYYELRKHNSTSIENSSIYIEFKELIKKIPIGHNYWAHFYSIIAIVNQSKDKDLSKNYNLKVLKITKNKPYLNHLRFRTYIKLALIKNKEKYFNDAIIYLDSSYLFRNINDSIKTDYYYKLYKSKILFNKKEYKKAYDYLNKSIDLGYQLDYRKNTLALSEYDKKYEAQKKEKENIKLRAEKIQNRNLLIASIVFIILGGTITTLTLQNSKRKRKLAEQEKELETQKNLTLLKEQEITTINAMVDGQEKERKRIAEDLHDNLGSVLATLKLHFENLKINREKKKINQEELFNKTENLIDEAYLKVRRIAHAKNAGVIANQGLLLAVQMMAEKISSADKINIEVIHYGLDKRLENTLELTFFRIIQELVTNIIKHADAKNATINLSLYEKNLNIIIEDDGKGFDIKKVDFNNGMGISSIKTRVEHLEGTFTIDATLGKGSSIILDIPIS